MHEAVVLEAVARMGDRHVVCSEHADPFAARRRPLSDLLTEQSIMLSRALGGVWTAKWEVSEELEGDWERKSKIRARCYLRLVALHNSTIGLYGLISTVRP